MSQIVLRRPATQIVMRQSADRVVLRGGIPGPSSGVQSAYHDDDADFPRPATSQMVIWVGTVTPNQMLDGDVLLIPNP